MSTNYSVVYHIHCPRMSEVVMLDLSSMGYNCLYAGNSVFRVIIDPDYALSVAYVPITKIIEGISLYYAGIQTNLIFMNNLVYDETLHYAEAKSFENVNELIDELERLKLMLSV